MKLKVYEMAFENEVGEYLDIILYPEEGWLSFSTDGKKEGFSVSSEEEWNEIDSHIRKFFRKNSNISNKG